MICNYKDLYEAAKLAGHSSAEACRLATRALEILRARENG